MILTLKMCSVLGLFGGFLLVVATVAGLPPTLTSTKLKKQKMGYNFKCGEMIGILKIIGI